MENNVPKLKCLECSVEVGMLFIFLCEALCPKAIFQGLLYSFKDYNYFCIFNLFFSLFAVCHSCIMKHLRTEQYCPRCEMMINKAKPNIK